MLFKNLFLKERGEWLRDWRSRTLCPIFGRGRKFFWPQTPPDRLWGPPIDLFNRCRGVYPRCNAAGEWNWPQYYRLLPSLRMSAAINPLPPYTSLACVSTTLTNPLTDLHRPRMFQEVEAPRFQDNRHMKVVRLSALSTGCFYPPGNIPGTSFS